MEQDDFDLPELDGGSQPTDDVGAGNSDGGAGGAGAPDGSATAATPPPSDTVAGATTTTAAAPPDTPTTPASDLPKPLLDALASEQLRLIPGETAEQGWTRLTTHLAAKGGRFYREMHEQQRRFNEQQAQWQAQVGEFRTALEPIIREYHQRAHAAQTEQLAAQIPDRETDPAAYAAWISEQVLIRDMERDRLAAENAEQARTAQAQAEQTAQIARVDSYGWSLLEEALGTPEAPGDPEVAQAYDVLTAMAMDSARLAYPNATEDQIAEFVGTSQQLEVRNWIANGYDPREVLRSKLRQWQAFAGQAPQQPVAGQQMQAQQPVLPQQPVQQPHQPLTTSPTLARAQQDAAAAAQRSPLSTPALTRPAGQSGAVLDPGQIEDEDEYVEAVLNGLFTMEQRVAPHRRFR